MAFVAVDKNKKEYIYDEKPKREICHKNWNSVYESVEIPKGSIEKLIGKKLTWEDEPVELLENEKYLKVGDIEGNIIGRYEKVNWQD